MVITTCTTPLTTANPVCTPSPAVTPRLSVSSNSCGSDCAHKRKYRSLQKTNGCLRRKITELKQNVRELKSKVVEKAPGDEEKDGQEVQEDYFIWNSTGPDDSSTEKDSKWDPQAEGDCTQDEEEEELCRRRSRK